MRKRKRINFAMVASSSSATVAKVYLQHKAEEHGCSVEHIRELLSCYREVAKKLNNGSPTGYKVTMKCLGRVKTSFFTLEEIQEHGGLEFFKSISISIEEV